MGLNCQYCHKEIKKIKIKEVKMTSERIVSDYLDHMHFDIAHHTIDPPKLEDIKENFKKLNELKGKTVKPKNLPTELPEIDGRFYNNNPGIGYRIDEKGDLGVYLTSSPTEILWHYKLGTIMFTST
jgi:hypothetical protein